MTSFFIINTPTKSTYEPRHDKTNIMRLHPRSLIRIHAVRLQTQLQVEKLIATSMGPDQTARMRRLVWMHAGRKPIMLFLSWRGSYNNINPDRIFKKY
jgi:hypothetical protein